MGPTTSPFGPKDWGNLGSNSGESLKYWGPQQNDMFSACGVEDCADHYTKIGIFFPPRGAMGSRKVSGDHNCLHFVTMAYCMHIQADFISSWIKSSDLPPSRSRRAEANKAWMQSEVRAMHMAGRLGQCLIPTASGGKV